MYKILITSALSKELNIIKKQIKSLKIYEMDFFYLQTWVWNYNTIFNLTKYLEKNKVDLVLNIWICWYKKNYKKFINIARIKNASNNKELIVPQIIDFWDLESIYSSEKVVFDSEIIWDENFVDMESFWVCFVCDNYKLPLIILKVPFDKIWEETKSFDFKKALDFLAQNIDYKTLFLKIKTYLNSKNKEYDFWYYFDYFNFTFSEKEIFKKLFFRYKALVWNDFWLYFEKNKKVHKKIFLKDLNNYLEQFLIK